MNTSASDSSQPGLSGLQVELGSKPKSRIRAVRFVALVVTFMVAIGSVWLYSQPRVTGTVGPIFATPLNIVVNTPTPVTFTVQIVDASVITTGVNLLKTDATGKTLAIVGVMRDDGTSGDAVANDKVFTYRLSVIEPAVGSAYYRASAPFKGVILRALSPVVEIHIDPFTLPTNANVTWSQPQVEAILSPGESTIKEVTFTSNVSLPSVAIEATSVIAPFVTIQPVGIASVPAGQPQTVRLAISIPAGTVLETYDGTVHVRVGSQTLPQTLKVRVNAWTRLTDSGLGLTVNYPPELFVRRPNELSNQVLIQSSPNPTNLGGVLTEDAVEDLDGFVIGIRIDAYTAPFTITQWLADIFPNSTVDVITPTMVSGIEGYRLMFKDEIGAGEPVVVLSLSGMVLQISYASTFAPASANELAGLAVYEIVLQTVRFQ